VYIAGGIVSVISPIWGDLYIVGWDISVTSPIQDDLFITGWNISITGDIGDDMRIVWGSIQIDSDIDGDLFIWGSDVKISQDVTIKWDLYIGAGRVVLDWIVRWKAKIFAGEFILNGSIGEDAEIMLEEFKNISGSGVIQWDLTYTSKQKLPSLEEISKSKVIYKQIQVSEVTKTKFLWFLTWYIVIKLLSLFVFSTLIYFYFEKYFFKVAKTLKKEYWRSLLYGFLTIGLIPIAIIILFMTIIWIPLALFLLCIYVFIFIFLSLINVVVLSAFFIKNYKVDAHYQKVGIIIWLTLIFGLINGIDLIIGFFTLGALMIRKIDVWKSLREEE
jgi:hypothetical protein